MSLLLGFICLSSCGDADSDSDSSSENESVVCKEGLLLAADGSGYHYAYSYDDSDRVVAAEYFDSISYSPRISKSSMDYSYAGERIYVVARHRIEDSNGEVDNTSYNHSFVRRDTLFLNNERADSCAGAIENGSTFHVQFVYDDRNQLIAMHNTNNMLVFGQETPMYSEHVVYEWKNGNIAKGTVTKSSSHDTTVREYSYSNLNSVPLYSNERVAMIDLEPLHSYFGARPRNLLSSERTTTGADTYSYAFVYTLDERNYISEVAITRDDMVQLHLKLNWK